MDSYTKLLLHCDGADESQTFIDEYGKTVTTVGNAQVDTAQKVFGTGSALFDGSGDYLQLDDSDDWDLSSENGCVDFRMRVNNFPVSVAHLIGQSQTALDGEWFIYLYSTGDLAVGRDGTNEIKTLIGTINSGIWYHIAVCKNGSTTTIYVNGVSKASNTTAVWNSSSNELRIGAHASGVYEFDGWIDELRFSKGDPRWTTDFTPPTAPYSTIENGSFTITSTISGTDRHIAARENQSFTILSSISGTDRASPSITNISVLQILGTGNVQIDYDIDAEGVQGSGQTLTVSFEYWDGDSWESCTTVTGDVGSILEGINKQAIWDAKTDIDGFNSLTCKIRIVATDWESQISRIQSSEFTLDVKDPIISVVTPMDASTIYDREFIFDLDITEQSSYQVKYEISILGGGSFSAIIDSGWLSDVETWDYTTSYRSLVYGTWYWRTTVLDVYGNQTVSSIMSFTLTNDNAQVRIDSITRLNDGSSKVKIDFSIKDINNEKMSIRFDYTDNAGDTYHPCKLTGVSSGTIDSEEDYIIGLIGTPSWVSYYVYFQYNDDANIEAVTTALKKRDLKVSSQVRVTRDGTTTDITNIVSGYNITRTRQLGSARAEIDIIDKDNNYNPENTTSAINQVSGNYDPLIYFGNTIDIFQKLLTALGIQSYERFNGEINNTKVNKKDAMTTLQVSVLDGIQKLIEYRPEDLEYNVTKQEVTDEILRTFDGITYYSLNSSWAEYPMPVITLNDEEVNADRFIIDFDRGQVIYKGNVLSKLVTRTTTCTNPSADRKKYETGLNFDTSILPTVYYSYDKYEQYSDNEFGGYLYRWVNYVEELEETTDYYIDYENGNIYLYIALSVDNSGETVGNINNQEIIVTYREAQTLKATYSYEVEGTNEVEDIIRNLATRAGISTSQMQKSVTDEFLALKDDKYLYTKYSNLISHTLYRNAITIVENTDYTIADRTGVITLEDKDYDSKNKMVEDCDYLWDVATATVSGESVTQLIDTSDKQEGTGSLKVVFPTNGGNVLRNLIGDLHNVTMSNQRYIKFYIKANTSGTVYLDISYDNSNWETKTILVTSSWQQISWDISGVGASYKEIKYLRLRGTNITVWLDDIYIKRNIYTCNYSYYTLQSSGITVSKVFLDYENTENAFTAIQELLKQVAPNYLIYIDSENYLQGYYSEQRLLKNIVTGWDNFSRGDRGYSRSYYAEHWMVKLPKSIEFDITKENIYTGVIVIGKNNSPANVAINGTAVDSCTWVTGKAYASKVSKNEKSSYGSDARAILEDSLIFEQLYNQNNSPSTGGAQVMLDMDSCLSSVTEMFAKINGIQMRATLKQLLIAFEKNYIVEIPSLINYKQIKWTRIVNMREIKQQSTFKIKFNHGESVIATDRHKWIRMYRTNDYNKLFGNKASYKFEEKEVISEELQVGDKIPYSYYLPHDSNINNIDYFEDIGYLLGVYFAEGNKRKNEIKLYCGYPHDQQMVTKIKNIAQKYNFNYKEHIRIKGSNWNVDFYDRQIMGIVEKYSCGDSCWDKYFSRFLWEFPKKGLYQVLKGYLDGDGYLTSKGYYIAKTCSKQLSLDIKVLCKILNIPCHVKIGKMYKNQRNKSIYWEIHVNLNCDNKQTWRLDNLGRIGYRKISAIERLKGKYDVIDLEVEDKNSLFVLANGVVTHNSNGFYWYKANDPITPNTLMAEITLQDAIKWDRISILIGSYEDSIIEESLIIKVGDNDGINFWYPDRNIMRVQSGSTGTWLEFDNNFNEDTPIKYVRIYCVKPFEWTVTTVTSKTRWFRTKVSSQTDLFEVFSIGEIQVWEKDAIVTKMNLDNVLIIGDGTTNTAQIPSTPYKTKDYLVSKYGWCSKYPNSVRLYKDSLSNELVENTDFTYDSTTGIVTFLDIPAEGEIVAGTWTYDERNPDETTYFGSFANKEIIKRVGLKYYKENDDGLYCYDDQTEILTENGWKYFKDLNKNEKVATLDDEKDCLRWHLPYKIYDFDYNGKMIGVENSRSLDFLVTPNHKMYIATRNTRNPINKCDFSRFRFMEAKELLDYESLLFKRTCENWEGQEQDYFYLPSVKGYRGLRNRNLTEFIYPEIKFKMDYWLEFLGWYLSEGSATSSGKHYTVSIAQSKTANFEKYKMIENCLNKLGFNYIYQENNSSFIIRNKQLYSYVKQFGNSQHKFIPKEIKNLSKRQLVILFDICILGDGTHGGRKYDTTSKQLADDMQEIAIKIGKSAIIRKYEGIRNWDKYKFEYVNYSLTISTSEKKYCRISKTTLSRLKEIDYSGKVYCVSVPNHIIMVRRNGKIMWSGNSFQKCLDRAVQLLPELVRSIYVASLDIVYRPDIKLGQTILVRNSELSLNRLFYIDEITTGMKGLVPTCNIGLTSFLEMKDYEYEETNPTIYKDFNIYYPQYIPAYSSFNAIVPATPLNNSAHYYTGCIAVEAIDDNGTIQEDYNEPCTLEVLSIEDSTSFVTKESSVNSDMWVHGRAEINFYIQWNQDGAGGLPDSPSELLAENKWYIDKTIVLKFYETSNPDRNKIFSTNIRLYLVGVIDYKYLLEAGYLGLVLSYRNYYINGVSGTGKTFVNDVNENFGDLGNYDANLKSIFVNGQTIWSLWKIDGTHYYIKKWNYGTSSWQQWGNQYITSYSLTIQPIRIEGIFAGKLIIYYEYGTNHVRQLWDGQTAKGLSGVDDNYQRWVIYDEKLYFVDETTLFSPYKLRTYVYDTNGDLEITYTQDRLYFGGNNSRLFVSGGNLYLIHYYGTTNTKWYIAIWNSSTNEWEGIYKYIQTDTSNDYPHPLKIFTYLGKIYFIMACAINNAIDQPFLAEFSATDNQIYNKGFLVNNDWGTIHTRAEASNKFTPLEVIQFENQIYLISSDFVLKNITPLIKTSKREVIYENQL